MAGETVITVIGNLTGDPELRFTPSGAAVANFTVASTPRTFDRQSNEWKDGETPVHALLGLARGGGERRRVAQPGTRVIVSGRLKSALLRDQEGEKRTVVEIEVDEVGPSLRYATAKVTKTQRGSGGGGFGGGRAAAAAAQQDGGGGRRLRRLPAAAAAQPAATAWRDRAPPAAQGGGQQGGWGSSAPSYDEPPF